jgi:magnesium-transporting ATPase (P-type)
VGIRGEEGVQAVNASDYAIAQFRFLTPLLLKHGRYNYLRMSNLVCYMFYKNIGMSLTMFWFNFFCAFSGEKMYTEGAIQFFNLFYTSIPILLYATYDKDVSPQDAVRFPQLYRAGIHNEFFNVSP